MIHARQTRKPTIRKNYGSISGGEQQEHDPHTFVVARVLKKTRSVSVGLLVLVASTGSAERYHVLMRTIMSMIATAMYAVDRANIRTMMPKKIRSLRERRPFLLFFCFYISRISRNGVQTHMMIYVAIGKSDT